MPKPNRYQGNGKVYPNGTRFGRYVMRNGHWVDFESPLGRHQPQDFRDTMSLAKWSLAVICAVVTAAVCVAVFGR